MGSSGPHDGRAYRRLCKKGQESGIYVCPITEGLATSGGLRWGNWGCLRLTNGASREWPGLLAPIGRRRNPAHISHPWELTPRHPLDRSKIRMILLSSGKRS